MNVRRKSRILIATDQTDKKQQLQSDLSAVDVDIEGADNWENVVQKLFSQSWALVIVDVDEENSYVRDLVELVNAKEQCQAVQLLFIVANSEPAARALSGLPPECFDVLARPANLEWLRNKVTTHVERQRKAKIADSLKFKLQCEITQNDTLQKELQLLQSKAKRLQSMQSIGVLVKNLSHEFNNVLGFAKGYLHMARKSADNTKMSCQHMEKAEIGMDRALNLVKKIQAYSSNSHYNLKPTELSSLIEYSMDAFEKQLPKHLEIVIHMEDESMAVHADKMQLQQVILGICENAVDAMGDKPGAIRLQVERQYLDEEFVRTHPNLVPGAYIRMSIIDQGIGMDESTLAHVFDPFFTTSEDRDNAGMGLSLAYSIVRNHDGEVTVHSDANEGTAVCIFLPELIVDTMQALELKMRTEAVSRDEYILLVENDLVLARLVKLMLQLKGFRVDLCDSAEGALKSFTATPHKWQFAVVDQKLQHMGGIELVQKLLTIKPDASIFLSGWDDSACHESNDIGIQGYVNKPYAAAQINALVERFAQSQVT